MGPTNNSDIFLWNGPTVMKQLGPTYNLATYDMGPT